MENNKTFENNKKLAELMDQFNFFVGTNNGIGLVCKTIFKKYANLNLDDYMKLKVKPKLNNFIVLEDFLKICIALTNEVVKEGKKIQDQIETCVAPEKEQPKEEKKESKIILG